MFITDSQVHIWGPDSPERPWVKGEEGRAHCVPPYDAEQLIRDMDEAGVNRTVIVPPSWEGDRNDVALAAVAAYPWRLGVMGRLDLRNPSAADVDHWLDQPGMLGVRFTFHMNKVPQNAISDADWFWPKAESLGIPAMVFAPSMPLELGEVARRYPELRLIVDHLNLSTSAMTEDIGTAIERLLPLSEFENVAVKISSLPCAIKEGYPFSTLADPVRRVVDFFGSERCMWGSDVTRLPCSYSDWVNAMAEGLGCLSAAETKWIMGDSIAKWLNWPATDSESEARGGVGQWAQ